MNAPLNLSNRVQYAYIAGTVLFTVYGQLTVKWRLGHHGRVPDGLSAKLPFFINLLLDPFIISGLGAGFLAALFWMAAMSIADVSYAYPFISAGLVLLTVTLAVLLFGEPMTIPKSAGVALIVAGVLTLAKSK